MASLIDLSKIVMCSQIEKHLFLRLEDEHNLKITSAMNTPPKEERVETALKTMTHKQKGGSLESLDGHFPTYVL